MLVARPSGPVAAITLVGLAPPIPPWGTPSAAGGSETRRATLAMHQALVNRGLLSQEELRRTTLALGTVVTSNIVVESLFGLPGLGRVLSQAIQANDFLVIYGIVLFITIAVATLMVVVELLYPLLDPRIRQE